MNKKFESESARIGFVKEEEMTIRPWVFKFSSVERGTYDRLECAVGNQIYPLIGKKVAGNVTAADLKSVLNHWMEKGYAYTTAKNHLPSR